MADGILKEHEVHAGPSHDVVVLLEEEVKPLGEGLDAFNRLVDLRKFCLTIALLLPGGLGRVPHEVDEHLGLLGNGQRLLAQVAVDQTQQLCVEPIFVVVRDKSNE